jgi:hypothetical protein
MGNRRHRQRSRCTAAFHAKRASQALGGRGSLRTKSGSPGADGRRSSSRRKRWRRPARCSPSGSCTSGPNGLPVPHRQSPSVCPKTSLPGPKQKSTCKFDSSARSVGTRICRNVFQKRPPPQRPGQAPFPCKSGRADARTRTGDPFITRERRVRDARPLAGTRGHVFAADQPDFTHI